MNLPVSKDEPSRGPDLNAWAQPIVFEHKFDYREGMSLPATTHPALAAAVARRQDAEAAERDVMRSAVAYAHAHPAAGATEEEAAYGDRPLELAGPGAPGVSEFAVAEFAAAMGMSTNAGRRFLGQALEVAHRLPRLWARLQAAEIPAWRARLVAERTIHLSEPAAAYVDERVGPIAGEIGPTRLTRVVEQARLLSEEPEADLPVDADATRAVHVDVDAARVTGVAHLDGTLDVADALDVEQAIQQAAAQLKEDGNDLPLDLRRSLALGVIARSYLTAHGRSGTSGVRLYVHYRPTDERGRQGFADLENTGGTVTIEQIRQWCLRPGARVTVTPVLDLAEPITSSRRTPSPRLREQVTVRDPACVFPYCHHRARTADLDHTVPYDPQGPPGQTASTNLAPLCRTHHRFKTHAGWTYVSLRPGTYLWTSPGGRAYLRQGMSTQELTRARSDGTTDAAPVIIPTCDDAGSWRRPSSG
jgi:hypothetical protein